MESSDLYNVNMEMHPTEHDAMDTAPFGEEGVDISHAGGDHEVFGNVVEDLARLGYGSGHR